MSELSFEQMLEDSVKTIRNGEIITGKGYRCEKKMKLS